MNNESVKDFIEKYKIDENENYSEFIRNLENFVEEMVMRYLDNEEIVNIVRSVAVETVHRKIAEIEAVVKKIDGEKK